MTAPPTAKDMTRPRGADGRFAARTLRHTLAKHSEQLAEQPGPPTFEKVLAAVEDRVQTRSKTA